MTDHTLDDLREARAVLSMLGCGHHAALHELLIQRGPVGALAWLTATNRSARDRSMYLDGMTADKLHTRATALRQATRHAGARVLIPEDQQWPQQLDDLINVDFTQAPAAALCLWARGRSDAQLQQMVAVTGSRAATSYGITVTTRLAGELADAGWTVAASGGYGIDAAALRGALAVNGQTVALLPCGIDRLYPDGNHSLLQRIAATGLLLSAYPPGTSPSRELLAGTARLLAAMTSGTLVVEAGSRSGSLISLREAAVHDRPAMVVPGPVTSAMSAGIHRALRQQAGIRVVRNSTDVLADLAAASGDQPPTVNESDTAVTETGRP
ncbi:DNA-protecting protein DprA [Actinoplanes sp. Pm04-4]|uniref:DNA-protecting protein DprA n=1 Tax=Paractinoplanes pyxinae TaxID=2997416 RepID=A0ABT4BBW3_9ACTN|nr:DNA-processing protein DprA [Actinoplanes pyxinae]MCY1144014.1 DNA-protecting protein DprA [Actinoplanes pyxinae]